MTRPTPPNTHISECHNAPTKLVSGSGDFSDHDEAVTMHYECLTCGQACNLVADTNSDALDEILNELISNAPESHVVSMTLYATQHTRPAIRQCMLDIFVELLGEDEPTKYKAFGEKLATNPVKLYRNQLRAELRRAAKERFKP